MFLGVFASVLSYLPFAWWLTDLLSHFRLQYALFFAVMVLVLAMFRHWLWVIAGVLLLAGILQKHSSSSSQFPHTS